MRAALRTLVPALALALVGNGAGCPGRQSVPDAAAPAAPVVPAAPATPAVPGVTFAATCVVARVIDGDTFVCDGGERVRLLLIDAPELDQGPYGARSRDALIRLIPAGVEVGLEIDVQERDRYRRLLAYVYGPGGLMANEELLRQGYAVVAVYPPNVKYVDRFRRVQEAARTARVGLWSGSAFDCLPADHRAGRCED